MLLIPPPLLHVYKQNFGKSWHSDNLAGTCWVQKRRHEGQEEEADGHKHKSKKVGLNLCMRVKIICFMSLLSAYCKLLSNTSSFSLAAQALIENRRSSCSDQKWKVKGSCPFSSCSKTLQGFFQFCTEPTGTLLYTCQEILMTEEMAGCVLLCVCSAKKTYWFVYNFFVECPWRALSALLCIVFGRSHFEYKNLCNKVQYLRKLRASDDKCYVTLGPFWITGTLSFSTSSAYCKHF